MNIDEEEHQTRTLPSLILYFSFGAYFTVDMALFNFSQYTEAAPPL